MAVSAEGYRRLLSQLLPPGLAWSQDVESVLQRLLLALGRALARVEQRSDELFQETDPRQTYLLLDRWEALLGLPDSCSVHGSQTVLERLQAVLAKLTQIGGLNRAYYLALAETQGYPDATITEYCARRHGRSAMGEPFGDVDWEEVWQLNLPAQQVTPRRHGLSVHGEPYQTWGDTRLECIITRDKPAGSIVFFSYGDR